MSVTTHINDNDALLTITNPFNVNIDISLTFINTSSQTVKLAFNSHIMLLPINTTQSYQLTISSGINQFAYMLNKENITYNICYTDGINNKTISNILLATKSIISTVKAKTINKLALTTKITDNTITFSNYMSTFAQDVLLTMQDGDLKINDRSVASYQIGTIKSNESIVLRYSVNCNSTVLLSGSNIISDTLLLTNKKINTVSSKAVNTVSSKAVNTVSSKAVNTVSSKAVNTNTVSKALTTNTVSKALTTNTVSKALTTNSSVTSNFLPINNFAVTVPNVTTLAASYANNTITINNKTALVANNVLITLPTGILATFSNDTTATSIYNISSVDTTTQVAVSYASYTDIIATITSFNSIVTTVTLPANVLIGFSSILANSSFTYAIVISNQSNTVLSGASINTLILLSFNESENSQNYNIGTISANSTKYISVNKTFVNSTANFISNIGTTTFPLYNIIVSYVSLNISISGYDSSTDIVQISSKILITFNSGNATLNYNANLTPSFTRIPISYSSAYDITLTFQYGINSTQLLLPATKSGITASYGSGNITLANLIPNVYNTNVTITMPTNLPITFGNNKSATSSYIIPAISTIDKNGTLYSLTNIPVTYLSILDITATIIADNTLPVTVTLPGILTTSYDVITSTLTFTNTSTYDITNILLTVSATIPIIFGENTSTSTSYNLGNIKAKENSYLSVKYVSYKSITINISGNITNNNLLPGTFNIESNQTNLSASYDQVNYILSITNNTSITAVNVQLTGTEGSPLNVGNIAGNTTYTEYYTSNINSSISSITIYYSSNSTITSNNAPNVQITISPDFNNSSCLCP